MAKWLAYGSVFSALTIACLCCSQPVPTDSYAEILAEFEDPPAEYRSAPLWVWNDRITEEQIETQLADFKAHGIGGVFIHPRPGLITPYLSEVWLSLCRHAVHCGRKLGMKVWIYDENSYPSGFAGGHVPAEMPDSIGLGLRMSKAADLPAEFREKPILVLRRTDSGFENVTERVLQVGPQSLPVPGDYYVFHVQKAESSPWFGGYSYVDLMRKEVTEKFLEITLNAYQRAFGEEFGATVPGSFQDEAHIHPAGGREAINFTPRLFEVFEAKWNYDLRIHLPSLFEEIGDWKKVRHDYYATLLGLFIENWAKPYYEYCSANHLALTGHYWEHEWPIPRLCPDNLALAAQAHVPGIDCLMNQWRTDPHAQFGNARAVREIRSAANQLGRRRTLSETYGASGWDLTFYDQKRIADWEFALGVNLINQHLSYVTIMGARKRDHPPSFSYHEPWWHAYRLLGDYLGRMSVVMSRGEQRNSILVIEPTTSAWMFYSPVAESDRFKAIGEDFQNFINRLESAQVEYDLASEDTLRNHGRAAGKTMLVGERSYHLIVLPPGLENLEGSTVSLISQYLEKGGKILSFVGSPGYVDGAASDQLKDLASSWPKNWQEKSESEAMAALMDACAPEIEFSGLEGDRSAFFHQRRHLADAQMVFLANISPTEAMSGRFSARGKSVESWDALSGEVSPYPSVRKGRRVTVSFQLPPGGSRLFCLRPKKAAPVGAANPLVREVARQGELAIETLSPNILTIDYCDLRLAGRSYQEIYFYDAQRKIFEQHGLGRNPWDSAVQFKTNILDLDKFGPHSGFEATYWFSAAPETDLTSLELVVERPELYTVFVNGRKAEAIPGRFWLDRAWGVFAIGRLADFGKNRITLRARPFSIHTELEPIYILGNFFLETADKGFKLVPSGRLHLGSWSEQGLPFYSGGVSYTKKLRIDSLEPRLERYVVRLGRWSGSVAEVKVRDRSAGFIAFEPFELEITDFLEEGENEIRVIVYGTLKNTLGPHHQNPQLGTAWPGMFQRGAEGGYPAGSAYHVVGYGLLDEFSVLVRTEE